MPISLEVYVFIFFYFRNKMKVLLQWMRSTYLRHWPWLYNKSKTVVVWVALKRKFGVPVQECLP